MFNSNKITMGQINICLKEINFSQKCKLLHSYLVKDIICLIQGRNWFDSNEFLLGSQILSLKQTNFI